MYLHGDAANNGDGMTIVAISRQKPWLEKTLKALAGGTSIDQIKPYTPWKKAPIIVPLGPRKGSSFPVALTAGNRITRMMKGKDLFLSKYTKLLGR